MKAIIVKPNKQPVITDIEDDLFVYQQIVDGYIEAVTIGNELVALVNEDGVRLGMSPNFAIGYTTLVGPAVIVRDTGKGHYQALTERNIKEAYDIINEGRYQTKYCR